MQVSLYRYERACVRPLPIPAEPRDRRRGLYLHLKPDVGTGVWGEASPLPGFSRESFRDAEAELEAGLHHFSDLPSSSDGWGGLETWSRRFSAASVRFAAETICVRRWQQVESIPDMRPKNSAPTVSNGLLSGPHETWPGQLAELLERGISTVKVKVGRASIRDDVRWLTQLEEQSGGTVRWRLDANRKWALSEALEICEAIQPLSIDYLEEPLADLSEWGKLSAYSRIPLALDEHLEALNPSDLDALPGLAVLVLKPTLRGGWTACRRWAVEADKRDVSITISSSFETEIGLTAATELARCLPGQQNAPGLDTWVWFRHNDTNPTQERIAEWQT